MAEIAADLPVSYDTVQKNPIDKNRKSTDYPFIAVLGIIFIIWFGASLYAITASPPSGTSSYTWGRFTGRDFIAIVSARDEVYERGIAATLTCVAFGISFICCVLLLLRWIPKVCIIFGIVCITITLIIYAFNVIHNLSNIHNITTAATFYLQILVPILNIIFLGVILFCAQQVGLQAIVDIIRKSLRALIDFKSLFAFGFLIFLVLIVSITFTAGAISNDGPLNGLDYIIIISYLYVLNSVFYFSKMVISEAIATWHCSERKDVISKTTVLRCISIVIRFHLGSVAFAATYILPLLEAIYVAVKFKFYNAPNLKIKRNIFVELTFKIWLIFSIADYAVIQTAVHGTAFFESVKKTFNLMLRKSSLSLAVIHIFRYVLTAAIVFAVIIVILASKMLLNRHVNMDHLLFLSTFIYIIMMMILPIMDLAVTAVHTTLLTTIEEEENEESDDKLTSHNQMI